MSQPQLIHRYLDANTNRLCSPGLSMIPNTNFDSWPLGTLVCVVLHACKGYRFELDATDGVTVPSANRASLAGFTGVPIFAVKTRTDWGSATDSFAASINSYYGALTDLANGVAAICGIFPLTVTSALDYMAQIQLLDANNAARAFPSVPLPIDIPEPLILGSEHGAPSTVVYDGVATIAESEDHIDVDVTGLTTSAIVDSLTQQSTGNGLSTFWATAATDILTINAGGVAPAGGYKIYWRLKSL